ncbi:acyltransferase family protein [Oscillospiraceae bacterium CM]|nr:acyltransferase family protein [Oscillospiraceae bacterium CM]
MTEVSGGVQPNARHHRVGFDLLKFLLALLVVARHAVQGAYPASSAAWLFVVEWLSNLAVPCFFIISGSLLFGRADVTAATVKKYLRRILRLYALWSLLYLPFTVYGWLSGGRPMWENLLQYAQQLVFASDIVQLWYLPALFFAVAALALLLKLGISRRAILLMAFVLLLIGAIGDSPALLARFPDAERFFNAYNAVFLTTRNGLFYGLFYTALGMRLGQTAARCRTAVLAAIFAVSLAVMFVEASVLHSVNMLVSAVPAAWALVRLCERVPAIINRGWAVLLRMASSLIYYDHILAVIALTLLWRLIGVSPNGEAAVLAAVTVSALVSLAAVALSRRRAFRWLRAFV